ncbi:hypothetical protein [Microbacterium karelineae]|uniref:hypothetical protein n=1 Tax=Microbacterium karelineae TaxID=2654283 RepID=UPI0012EA3BD1|nr:hypothetical protein [Microbacterium karelineae]
MSDDEATLRDLRRVARHLRWGYSRPALAGAVACVALVGAMAASAVLASGADGFLQIVAVFVTFGGGGVCGAVVATMLAHRTRSGGAGPLAGALWQLLISAVLAALVVLPALLGVLRGTIGLIVFLPLLPFVAVVAMVAVRMVFGAVLDALAARAGIGRDADG